MVRGLFQIICIVLLAGCGNARWQAPDQLGTQQKSSSEEPLKVRISTMNLKFYGTGGGFHRPGKDHRSPYIKRFVLQELHQSDVVVFTEVVDIQGLRKMVSGRWKCAGYDRSADPNQQWHQHVTICFDAFRFSLKKFDDDWVVPETTLGSRFLRPAVQAKLCHVEGQCFMQVFGVHLKAGQSTGQRKQQIQALSDELLKQDKQIPTVIVGDFNSYRKNRSGYAKHDMEYFEEILSESGLQYRSLTWGVPTYGTGDSGRDYDHVVASNGIRLQDLHAYPACGAGFDPHSNVLSYEQMRELYTDHCYVTTELQIDL